ncbi:MAG: hypothetical protein J0M12_11210, partial [Deltaproteobacteria bacterium]|nr:hypothetical protein [Deltaproteobacteria bacterium]
QNKGKRLAILPRSSSRTRHAVLPPSAAAKKLYTETVGTISVSLKAGRQKKVKIKLNSVGQKFISALRKSGVPSVELLFTLKSQRTGSIPKGAKRKTSVVRSVDVAL